MVTTPPELHELRILWSTISGQQSWGASRRVNLTLLARRTATIAHLVPGQAGPLSKAYISQLLNPSHDRNPGRESLVTMVLAMSALYRGMRDQLEPETREAMDRRIQDLLLGLNVRNTSWADPEFPLSAYSENLIVHHAFERQLNSNFQTPGFAVSLSGGYRQGKSTAIARALDRLRVLGYDLNEVSISTLSLERVDTAEMYQQFTTALEVADVKPETAVEFDQVIARWLARKRSSRVALIIDNANVLLDAASASALPRAILRDWSARVRRSPDDSPWRKLSILIASTYTPDVVGSAAVASRSPMLTNFAVEDFDLDQVLQLMQLWINHIETSDSADSASITHVPKEPDQESAAAVVHRYGGHPYLIHAAVKNWVMPPKESTSILASNAAVEAGYADAIERLVKTVRLSRPGDQAGVGSLESSKLFHVAMSNQALENLGLSRDEHWASPFVESVIAPRLPKAGGGLR